MFGKITKLSIVALAVFSLSGCGPTVLLKKPVEKQNKTWTVEVTKVYDGVGYSSGNTVWYPPAGNRFVRTEIKIQNNTNDPQKFRLDKVYLVSGENGSGPSIVDMNTFVTIRANETPTLSPKEKISRALIYSFPYDLTPQSVFIKGLGHFKIPEPVKK